MGRSTSNKEEAKDKAVEVFEMIQPASDKIERYNIRRDGDYSDFVVKILEEAFVLGHTEAPAHIPAEKFHQRSEIMITCYVVQRAMHCSTVAAENYDGLLDRILYKVAQIAQLRHWDLSFTQKAITKKFGLDFISYLTAIHS